MALPFYSQGDQDIYASGNKFIPQEQYRLNYTPSQSLASTIGNTGGVTGAQAANPYIWPPLQGAGDGPSGLHNVYGYDPNKTKTFSKQVWSKTGPTEGWTTQDVTGYWSPSGWKTAKGKNINHAGLEVPTLMGTIMNKFMGIKPGDKQVGDIKGTFTKDLTEEEEEINAAAVRRNLLNKIKAKAYTGPINVGGGAQDIPPGDGDPKIPPPRHPPSTWTPAGGNGGGTGSPGGGAQAAGDLAGGSALDSPFAEGGRIGFKDGLSAYQLFKLKELGYGNAASNPGSYGGLGVLRDILKLHKYKDGGRIGMAKGKIPLPRAKKSGSSFPWTRLQLGLSSLLNRNPLTLGKIPGANTASYGSKAWRAQQLANMAKMGKWSGRAASLGRLGVMNPWFMAPAALTGLAKYSVGKAFDPYRDETGKIGAEGHAQLASAARAREALMAERNAARQNQNAGGIARLL